MKNTGCVIENIGNEGRFSNASFFTLLRNHRTLTTKLIDKAKQLLLKSLVSMSEVLTYNRSYATRFVNHFV